MRGNPSSPGDGRPPAAARPVQGQLSFDELLEFVPDAVLGVRPDGVIVRANREAAALFGYERDALIGRRVEVLVPERFRSRHVGYRSSFHANPHTRPMGAGLRLSGRRHDGTEFPAEIMLSSIGTGEDQLALVAVRDVSDQLARGRLAAIVESTADAIVAEDREGLVTQWNAAAEQLYGYRADEVLGTDARVTVPPDRLAETDRAVARVLAGQSLAPYETTRRTRDGELVDVSVSISPIRDAAGAVVGASTIARDIRARLKAEADRLYTEALVQSSPAAIVGVAAAGIVTAWNPRAEELFGVPAAEAVGRSVDEVVVADGDEQRDVLLRARAGRSQVYEGRRRRRDGGMLDVSVSVAPIRGRHGEFAGAVSIVRDVTAQRETEALVEQARQREARLRDELNQTRRLDSLGQLAGGVAHDFNNLLGVIINYSKFVADGLPEDSQEAADVREILRAAERGAALTRQLLIFSRREVVDPEVLDVNELIGTLENLLRRALGERVALETHLAGDLSRVTMDRGQLEQVLVNLAVNARDAMPDGGRLIVETSNVALDHEYADGRATIEMGEYVLIQVSDTGSGMSPEALERAFEPFFTTKPKGEGTGLGLATVYGIVSEADGRIALYSEPGLGTSAKVYLRATHAEATRRRPASGAGEPGRGETVLVVEDEQEVRRLTTRILERAGYAVVAAANGAECLAVLRDRRVDVLLTDVIMPGMLGPDVAARARELQDGLPVVYMSGYADRVLSQDTLTAEGAAGFIEKPFTAHDLQRKVRDALEGR